jgi:hypothetical protein
MNRSSKYDVYLLAELPSLNTLPHNTVVSIGFGVEAVDVDSMRAVRTDIKNLFEQNPICRLTSAHWPASESIITVNMTADVTMEILSKLESIEAVREIQLCRERDFRRALRPRAPRKESASAPVPQITNSNGSGKKKKILAVIDHGCPFANAAFRDAQNKSLIHAIWDQDPNPDFPEKLGTTPVGFGYGRQVNRSQLSEWIYPVGSVGVVDEGECYRRAEYDALNSRVSHGSVVLGLLGQERLQGTPESVRRAAQQDPDESYEFVFVQIPRSVPVAPTRGSVDRYLLDGLRYIISCAPDDSEVAVVLDYGTEMGPHDGSSWYERALDAMVEEVAIERKIKLTPVYCSGNSFEAKRVLVVNPNVLAPKKDESLTASFSWNVPRGNDTEAYLEIWTDIANTPTLSVRPAGGSAKISIELSKDEIEMYWPDGGGDPSICQCKIISKLVGGNRQILISVAPTRFDENLVTATPGSWQMELYWVDRQNASTVYAYTHWGGKNIGFPQRTWAPRFSAAPINLQTGLLVISGKGSTWGSACGQNVVVAGSYQNWTDKDRAKYSSAGVVRGGKFKPDYLMLTEELPSLHGLLGLGHRSGTRVRASGTSFAAPQLARFLLSGIDLPPQPTLKTNSDVNSGIRIP